MAGNFQITLTDTKSEILLRIPGTTEWIDITNCVKSFSATAGEIAEVTLIGTVVIKNRIKKESEADANHD